MVVPTGITRNHKSLHALLYFQLWFRGTEEKHENLGHEILPWGSILRVFRITDTLLQSSLLRLQSTKCFVFSFVVFYFLFPLENRHCFVRTYQRMNCVGGTCWDETGLWNVKTMSTYIHISPQAKADLFSSVAMIRHIWIAVLRYLDLI
jgi:hypothetical protein